MSTWVGAMLSAFFGVSKLSASFTRGFRSFSRQTQIPWRMGLFLAILSNVLGCANSQSSTAQPPAPQAPFITQQPANTTTPLGQSATFTVMAGGTTPLVYQWSKNGTVILGASASSYTTPPVAVTDNSSTFTVAVSNSLGTVASSAAVLTVSARAPKAGDLRFQQVEAPPTVMGYANDFSVRSNLDELGGAYYDDAYGLPLEIGPLDCVANVEYDCGYFYMVFQLPSGLPAQKTIYTADSIDNLQSDLTDTNPNDPAALGIPNTVITSFDMEAANNIYAAALTQATGQAGGFDLAMQTVSPSNFQAAALQLGVQSRVITAVSYNSGQISFISYGWQGDTTTVYDVKVSTSVSDSASVFAAATSLAAASYIITAFGGDAVDGYILVGTRVSGDSLPRPIFADPDALPQSEAGGYAIVGNFLDSTNTLYVIGEK